MNSRGSSPAVGRFAPAGLPSLFPRLIGMIFRASLMDRRILSRVQETPEFTALASYGSFLDELKKGTHLPEPTFGTVPPLGVVSVELDYSWSGLGKSVDESRLLIWNSDQALFVEKSSGQTVPPWIIHQILQNLEPASPSRSLA